MPKSQTPVQRTIPKQAVPSDGNGIAVRSAGGALRAKKLLAGCPSPSHAKTRWLAMIAPRSCTVLREKGGAGEEVNAPRSARVACRSARVACQHESRRSHSNSGSPLRKRSDLCYGVCTSNRRRLGGISAAGEPPRRGSDSSQLPRLAALLNLLACCSTTLAAAHPLAISRTV